MHLTLGEPRRDAWKIALSCFEAKAQQRSNYRSMATRSDWRIATNSFPPRVFTALADSGKPLVILTVHQADYLAGLLAVLRLIPLEREIHIIKLAEWTQIEQDAYEHFRKYGHTLVIHRLSERPAKRIVRALKRKAILVTFVDVPREFGTTAPVRMFGLPFQLTSGPLAMARLAGASVLPVFSNYSEDNNCEVRSGAMISVANKPSVATMAQQLAAQIEGNLKRYPAQWEMWPVIQNLLDRDALLAEYSTLSTPLLMRLATVGLTPAEQPKQHNRPPTAN